MVLTGVSCKVGKEQSQRRQPIRKIERKALRRVAQMEGALKEEALDRPQNQRHQQSHTLNRAATRTKKGQRRCTETNTHTP
jgi:hypothetical protein